jgi:hypothetical protein
MISGELLQEVLLVDDFSEKTDLGDKLETYIKRFRGKVKNHSITKLTNYKFKS